MQISVSVLIDAPIESVWAEAVDFGSHHEWMIDAVGIEFEGEQRTGAGTVMLVETRVGPLRTLDRFTITEVVEPRLIRGEHKGSVTGLAKWMLSEHDGTTEFVWAEELHFPWFFGWKIGELIARPIMAAMWRKNLQQLKQRVEQT